MSEIRLYIEGDRRLRPGFGMFFERLRDLARSRRVGWDIKLCGGRNSAFDDFKTALDQHPGAFNILLLDSEGPLNGEPWDHLRKRDGWTPPAVGQDHCHLMVQNMEAWFIADPSALKSYYMQNFNEKALSKRQNVEKIDRSTVEASLASAIRQTSKPKYEKVIHGVEILTRLNEGAVRARAPRCDRLFRTIETKIEELAQCG